MEEVGLGIKRRFSGTHVRPSGRAAAATVGPSDGPGPRAVVPRRRACAGRYNTPMQRTLRFTLGLAAAGLAAVLASWTGAPSATATATAASAAAERDTAAGGVVARDAVWRAIFARPVESPAAPDDAAKVALGRDLFRDVRLSGSGRASCATCHDPAQAFTDGRKTAVGPSGTVLARNTPALYNLAWATSFFWDGRAASLGEQAKVPLLAPDELAGDLRSIAQELSRDAEMSARFAAAFPAAPRITEAEILAALAAYERSLISPETRFDRWVQGDDEALSPQELKGFDIFVGKGGCVSCHGGWRLTDDAFHDVGLPGTDRGRGALAPGGLPEFKTPSLREVARTAPYMHDGSLATLEDVVLHYAGGLVVRPSLAPTILRDLTLSKEEKADLVAFLKTLSSEQKSHTSDGTTRPMLEK
jgi:cytochrome c peroxidase